MDVRQRAQDDRSGSCTHSFSRNMALGLGILGLLWTAGIPCPAVALSPTPLQIAANVARPLLKSGSSGTDVSELQAALKLLGYYNGSVDGVYGESTAIAVSSFQQAAGLAKDGIVGPATWNRLFPADPSGSTPAPNSTPTPGAATFPTPTGIKPQPAPTPTVRSSSTPNASSAPKPATSSPSPADTSVAFPVLKLGMRGSAVVGLQQRLKTIGVLKGAIDGVFGPDTQEAVKAAQRLYKLDPDGVVGPATWNALLR